ncbi:unnamed protein product [Paramecium primaurelia]|uniref:Uncharacterized protein n=1 Tax=Paramecium primaurelia TaxID=5886 RepID=A0A8S1LYF4_PARPR|nr:unnamed protein product [Paramecium primaurelia]
MISNDTLTPMQQTAQFYIPPGFSFNRRTLKRLNPQNNIVEMQTINKNQNLNMKSNSQPNLLNLTRDKNFSFYFESQQQSVQQNSVKKQLSLLGIQQRLLFPIIPFKKQNSLNIDSINSISSPQKSKKILRTLLMPQKKSQNLIISQKEHRSTRSQGRSILQSRPQLNLLNRIFSQKSQHQL